MDQRPRRSVFERLGRLPREYSNSGPGNSGNSQALLPGPPPLLRYPERVTHDLNPFQRNPRRRLNNYDDHYNGPVKKTRLELDVNRSDKPQAPILQLRQMPLIVPQEKKPRLRRRKPRPVDETLDEGEIIDDEDEYEEYSEEEEEEKVKIELKTNLQISLERKSLSLKESDNFSLKSFESTSDKTQSKIKSVKTPQSTVKTTVESDKGSNYSDWSDDEILLRDDVQKVQEESKIIKKEDNENDSVFIQNSGFQSKIQELEAISDDDFDAYDQDLLERNKDCMEEMLADEMISTNDVSMNDILSIDWKSLLTVDNNKQKTLQRRTSTENRSNKSKCCLEMLNRIGHSAEYASNELSDRIKNILKQELNDKYVEQTDKLALLHNFNFNKCITNPRNSSLNVQNTLPVVENTSYLQDELLIEPTIV